MMASMSPRRAALALAGCSESGEALRRAISVWAVGPAAGRPASSNLLVAYLQYAKEGFF